MTDLATVALRAALTGLSARQRVLADNVANAETPGFTAGRVDFEESLRAALEDGEADRATLSGRRSAAAAGPNGNNVSLDEEVVALVDTGLRYQLMVEAMNAKVGLLRTSIGGGR